MDIDFILKFYRSIVLFILYWLHGATMKSLTKHSTTPTEISTTRLLHQGNGSIVFQNNKYNYSKTRQHQDLTDPLFNGIDMQYLTSSNPLDLFHKVQTYNRKLERFKRQTSSKLDYDNQRLCCPTVSKRVKLLGGKTKDKKFVKLFNTRNSTQRFYITKCHKDFKHKKCQFIEPRYKELALCLPLKSWTYAVVRDFNSTSDSDWRVDYIQYDVGCTCKMRRLLPEDRTPR